MLQMYVKVRNGIPVAFRYGEPWVAMQLHIDGGFPTEEEARKAWECENGKKVEKVKNRDLDGCYFRVERDGKWKNICFSDLTEEERENVLKGFDEGALKSLCCHLADRLAEIGDQYDIVCED